MSVFVVKPSTVESVQPEPEHKDSVEVPPDPFCLQPYDPFTLSLIRVWIVAAGAMKVNPLKLQRAEQHYKEIKAWQKKHGTKKPD